MHKEIKSTLIQISVFIIVCLPIVHISVHVPEQLSVWQSEDNLQGSVISFYHWSRIEFRLSAFSIDPHFQPMMFVFAHCLSGPRTQSRHLHNPLRALCYIFSSQ